MRSGLILKVLAIVAIFVVADVVFLMGAHFTDRRRSVVQILAVAAAIFAVAMIVAVPLIREQRQRLAAHPPSDTRE
jgi:hypothetical protein